MNLRSADFVRLYQVSAPGAVGGLQGRARVHPGLLPPSSTTDSQQDPSEAWWHLCQRAKSSMAGRKNERETATAPGENRLELVLLTGRNCSLQRAHNGAREKREEGVVKRKCAL